MDKGNWLCDQLGHRINWYTYVEVQFSKARTSWNLKTSIITLSFKEQKIVKEGTVYLKVVWQEAG